VPGRAKEKLWCGWAGWGNKAFGFRLRNDIFRRGVFADTNGGTAPQLSALSATVRRAPMPLDTHLPITHELLNATFAVSAHNAKALRHGLGLHGRARRPDGAQQHLHLPFQSAGQCEGGVLSGEFGEVREVWSLGSIGQHQETPVQLTPWHVQIICAVAGAAAARQSPSNAKMDRGVGGAACVGRARGLV
jgi:hypothetical protein